MAVDISKSDVRALMNGLTAALICVLTVVAVALAFSWEAAGYWLLFVAAGFAVARVLARQGVEVPTPRAVQRKWLKGSFRRAASDQPFNTRVGWTSGSEPAGDLPDARGVTPYGKFGGGLWADTFAGLLIIAALFFQLGRGGGSPLGALIIFSVWGIIGFVLIRLARRLRQR